MLYKIQKPLIVALAFFGFTACNFHTEADMDSMDDMSNGKEVNINYPAAYVVNGESNNIEVINLNDLNQKVQLSLNGAMFPHHINLRPDQLIKCGKDLLTYQLQTPFTSAKIYFSNRLKLI